MGGYGAPDSAHGLKGSLWYIPPTTQSRYATVADIDKLGVEINASLYLSDLDVRTRLYNTGFPTTAGNLLKAPDGSVLTEWFGMKLDTEIRLTGYDEPGLYQFALLADDGAIMDVKPTKTATGYTLLVNDDRVHPSELSCADTAIPMDRNSSIPVHIDYFQGPRNHIALMLLWRNLTDSHHAKLTMAESLCGRSGNGLFWDYTQTPSAPQAAWWQLRADYWSVVAARNYFLPGTAVNPCFAHY